MKRLISGLMAVGCASLMAAQSNAMELRNNPFSQPKKHEVAAIQESDAYQKVKVQLPIKNLRAVIVSPTRPMANLDGHILTIGEEIDGFKLLSVKESQAVFEWQGEKHTLTLGDNDLDNADEAKTAKK